MITEDLDSRQLPPFSLKNFWRYVLLLWFFRGKLWTIFVVLKFIKVCYILKKINLTLWYFMIVFVDGRNFLKENITHISTLSSPLIYSEDLLKSKNYHSLALFLNQLTRVFCTTEPPSPHNHKFYNQPNK